MSQSANSKALESLKAQRDGLGWTPVIKTKINKKRKADKVETKRDHFLRSKKWHWQIKISPSVKAWYEAQNIRTVNRQFFGDSVENHVRRGEQVWMDLPTELCREMTEVYKGESPEPAGGFFWPSKPDSHDSRDHWCVNGSGVAFDIAPWAPKNFWYEEIERERAIWPKTPFNSCLFQQVEQVGS